LLNDDLDELEEEEDKKPSIFNSQGYELVYFAVIMLNLATIAFK